MTDPMSDTSESWDIAFVGTGDPSLDNFPDPNSGGSGPIWRLAREFHQRGHDVSIYAAYEEEAETHLVDDIRIIPVEIPNLPISYRISGLGLRVLFSYGVHKQLKQEEPDIVYLRERLASIFPSRLDIPTIFTIVSPDACDFYYSYSVEIHPLNRVLFRYKRWAENLVCQNVSEVIVMNYRMSEYYSERGIENLSTITISIDEEDFVDLSEVQETNAILFVGRLDDNKRPEWVLRAYESLNLSDEHELFIVGSGHRRNEIEKLTEELGIGEETVFTGNLPREDILDLMTGSKALVLPSKFEMAGNVIIEAMATGCPVIASNTMGARYLVEDRKTGMLFDKENEGDLRDTLQKCLNDGDLRQSLRENGREVAKNQYTTKRIADEYLYLGWEKINNTKH